MEEEEKEEEKDERENGWGNQEQGEDVGGGEEKEEKEGGEGRSGRSRRTKVNGESRVTVLLADTLEREVVD